MRRPLPVLLACLAVCPLAGCGGDDGPAPATRGPGTVVMSDYEFHPRDVRTRRGDSLTVLNEGGIAHNLKVERGPNPREQTDELTGTSSFLKGDHERLEIDLPPGRYVMVCTVPGHRELGMVGTLRVR